jgi:chromosome segregation ATPase
MSIATFVLFSAAYVWGGLFRFSRLESKVDALAENLRRFEIKVEAQFEKIEARFEKIEARFEKMEIRFEKIENKIENLRLEIHQIDLRVTKLEQSKS